MNVPSTVSSKATALVANIAGLKHALVNVQSSIPSTGGDPFLRLLKDGAWVYGAENIEVEAKSRWAVNIFGLEHGWVAWTDFDKADRKPNEIVHERMVPMDQPLPQLDELPRTNWPYQQQLLMPLTCMTGEDRGVVVRYKTTSTGGLNAVRKVIGEVMAQLDRDPATPVPLLELNTDHYAHKTYGRTYVPVLDVVGWVAAADNMPTEAQVNDATQAGGPDAQVDAKPARRRAATGETAKPAEDPVAAKRRELEAELATLKEPAPAADAPIRRRRNA